MNKEFFYYDKKNELFEYFENRECFYAEWINYFLTLYYSQENNKIIGFSITWLEQLLKRAENQKIKNNYEENREFYYYDKKNDKYEYFKNEEEDYREVINKYLILWHSKKDNKVDGFEINGLNELLKKAKEEKNRPLTSEEKINLDLMYKLFEEKEK